jgi:hypothetical protein
MTVPTKVTDTHYESAREHLAGLAAGRAWHQDLAAAHLLRTQTPISRGPINDVAETGKL